MIKKVLQQNPKSDWNSGRFPYCKACIKSKYAYDSA